MSYSEMKQSVTVVSKTEIKCVIDKEGKREKKQRRECEFSGFKEILLPIINLPAVTKPS